MSKKTRSSDSLLGCPAGILRDDDGREFVFEPDLETGELERAYIDGRNKHGTAYMDARDPETGKPCKVYFDEKGRRHRMGEVPGVDVLVPIYEDQDGNEFFIVLDQSTGEERRSYLDPEIQEKRDFFGRPYRMCRNPATGERVKRYL